MGDPTDQTTMTWSRLVAAAILLCLLSAPALHALPGGGGGGGGGGGSKGGGDTSKESADDKKDEDAAVACPEITGTHPLLDKMASDYGLSCTQEDKIQPLLHGEEAVLTPLFAYGAFTPEEKQAMMAQVVIAWRVPIRPVLTPSQQKKSDKEIAKLQTESPKKSSKRSPAQADAYAGEEALTRAIATCAAFSYEQKKDFILQLKQAARRDGAPPLTADQAAKIDGDIAQLQQK